MKKFTFLPQMFLLKTGPVLASFRVLVQMPLKWVDPRVKPSLISLVALDQHLSPRALYQYEVHRGLQ